MTTKDFERLKLFIKKYGNSVSSHFYIQIYEGYIENSGPIGIGELKYNLKIKDNLINDIHYKKIRRLNLWSTVYINKNSRDTKTYNF